MTSVKNKSGFTLLELMIVVAIISILAASAAVGFGSSMAEGKAADLIEDLVRIGRAARSRPLGTGMAHRLVYLRSPSNGLGVLRLDVGNSNLCNLVSQWTSIEAVNAIDFTGGDPGVPPPTEVRILDFEPANTILQTVQLCYEPRGTTLIRITAEGEDPLPNADDTRFIEGIVAGGTGVYDVVFQVKQTLEGEQRGVVRSVRFPYGGSARIQR